MIFAILCIIAGIVSIILSAMVVASGTSAKNSKWPFVLFATSVGVWALGVGAFGIIQDTDIVSLLVPVYYIAALVIAYSLLLFCIAYTGYRISGWMRLLAFVPTLGVAVVVALPGMFIGNIDAVSKSVELVPSAYIIYSLYFISYVGIGLVLLWRRALSGKSTRRYKLLALWFSLCLIGGAVFNLLLPGLGMYQFVTLGPLFTFIMVAAVFYAIARHGLFDIRLAVVRTVTYVFSLATLAGIYLLIVFFIFDRVLNQASSVGQITVNVALTLALAFLFQPVRRFFDKWTNKIFYQDNYSVGFFFAELSRELTVTTNLQELLVRAATTIGQTMKVGDVSFIIRTGHNKSEQAGYGHFKKVTHKDMLWLDGQMENRKAAGPMVLPLLDDTEISLRRMMVSHRITVILPLVRQGVLLGYLLLGEHQKRGYSTRDIRVLSSLADELIIAIQNALSIEQIKELNAHLEQRIDAATKELRASNLQLQRLDEAKDEFISMASHQLRTPLTSIKGYISMMMEGDVGKITPEQKHVLNETFISSERMVRLIGDFLNVSRLQTGKFVIEKRPIDLAALVGREIESLKLNAAPRGITFVYKKPASSFELELDENKIQQVIMNFSDNAIYYSKDNSKVHVTLKKVAGFVEFKVKDSGIGVPEAEQEQLFNKFFRATNARRARPDGTGVGLFLAKKVIDDHGGEIIFESTEGKGSTFGFRLPLPK